MIVVIWRCTRCGGYAGMAAVKDDRRVVLCLNCGAEMALAEYEPPVEVLR